MSRPPVWSDAAFERLGRWLAASPPAERCFVGLGRRGRVTAWVKVGNLDRRFGRFRMSERDLLVALDRARRCGLELVVLGHTHPGVHPEPSAHDRAALAARGGALWPGVWSLVVATRAREPGRIALTPPVG